MNFNNINRGVQDRLDVEVKFLVEQVGLNVLGQIDIFFYVYFDNYWKDIENQVLTLPLKEVTTEPIDIFDDYPLSCAAQKYMDERAKEYTQELQNKFITLFKFEPCPVK